MMDEELLAEEIKEALGAQDQETSDESIGFARAIIKEFTLKGLVNFAPGGITGVAPPSGGPLINGAGSNGIISGITGPSLASNIVLFAGFPGASAEVLQFAASFTSYVISTGKVAYKPGEVTGICSNTGANPGVLTGEAKGGQVTGITGDGLASLIAPLFGSFTSEELKAFSNAVIDHIKTNAVITFVTGTVTGTASAGGGPLVAGAATAGRFS